MLESPKFTLTSVYQVEAFPSGEADPRPSLSTGNGHSTCSGPLTGVMTSVCPLTGAESGGNVSPQPRSLVSLARSITILTTAGHEGKCFHYTSFQERGRVPSPPAPRVPDFQTGKGSWRAALVGSLVSRPGCLYGKHWGFFPDHFKAGRGAAREEGLPNCCVKCQLYYQLTISRETGRH